MSVTKIKTMSVVVTIAVLTGCASGGGGVPSMATAAPQPAVTPVTTPCAANTFCGVDAVTLSEQITVTLTGPNAATIAFTGTPAVLGATAFTATLDPATGSPTSAIVSGSVNTSVPALTPQATGALAGAATNGQYVVVTAHGSMVPATTASPAAGLTYSNFGDWAMLPVGVGTQTYLISAWAGGTQFTTTMPVTGTATYAGVTSGAGLVNTAGTWIPFDLAGNLALTANFTPAGGAIAGNITGISATTMVAGLPFAAGSFNDIALAATISGNGFSGIVVAGAVPAGNNPAAIAANTAGTTAGHFYGPAANEVTGVWSMSTPTAFAAGSFGAKQGTVSSVNNGTSAGTVPGNAVSPPSTPVAPPPSLTFQAPIQTSPAAPAPGGTNTISTGVFGMAGNATGRFYGPGTATATATATNVAGAP